ncbi:hypothetical protein EXIGLDRAFT_719629 [Exidia glandulosa HHB12029]|uniref:Uncharacterized protein n=1 Tax=Exidia glandulosa HHB12029 TaxID=1314781 RepID=A0A165GYB1_EXIGL|nr:hypothetical protein EXIGLDRAFT_719629 [Exidia glandulosa HHB12029]
MYFVRVALAVLLSAATLATPVAFNSGGAGTQGCTPPLKRDGVEVDKRQCAGVI